MDLGSCREVIKDGRPVFWLTMSLKQFGPLDESLKSIVVPAKAVSGNTFRSIPWWTDTNGFTQRFLIWKPRDDHETGHCQTIPPQPHPHQGRDPLPSGNRSQRGGREGWDEYIMLFRSHLRTGRSIIGLARSPDGFRFTADPQPFLIPDRDSPFAAYEEFGVETHA